MDVILIGNVDEVKAAAEKGNFCICKATIIAVSYTHLANSDHNPVRMTFRLMDAE